MKEIYCFSKGEEQISLSSKEMKNAGEIAIKAILTHLPEEQRTYDIIKYILNTACDLLGEKEIKKIKLFKKLVIYFLLVYNFGVKLATDTL